MPSLLEHQDCPADEGNHDPNPRIHGWSLPHL